MLTSWQTLIEIALRTTIYVLVLLGIRLTGKREVGQMRPFDLTLLLLISNSVQNAMTGTDTYLVGGAGAASVLLALNYLLADLSGMNRRLRRAIQGSPTLLVHNGTEVAAHMAKEHISADALIARCGNMDATRCATPRWWSSKSTAPSAYSSMMTSRNM